jgi:transcriptional regulator NrdR family protein
MPQKRVEQRTAGYSCAECGSFQTLIQDSRPMTWQGNKTIRRRRICQVCGHRESTVEIAYEDAAKWIGEMKAAYRRDALREAVKILVDQERQK